MVLVHDEGLNQYDIVRKAYDQAKEILSDPARRKAELSGLVALMQSNKDGLEWLMLEEGKGFDAVYKMFQYHLDEAKKDEAKKADEEARKKSADFYELQRRFEENNKICRQNTLLVKDMGKKYKKKIEDIDKELDFD
ncbi:MAG: hypothetical protein WC852_05105 [Candidatus Nanoarchaeia archaeon]